MGKRSWRTFYYVIWENRLGAFSCATTWLPQYKCVEIFKTLNNRNFCIYWCIDLKLVEILQNGGYLQCVIVLSRKSLIQIFDDVIANYEHFDLITGRIQFDCFDRSVYSQCAQCNKTWLKFRKAFCLF